MLATQSRAVLLAALASVAAAGSARATMVTIQPSSQDASILQDFPNRPKGSGTNNTRFHVRTSTPNPRIRRGLVQFDLSSVPQFSTINSATLDLYQDSSPVGLHTNDVHRISDPWLQATVKWNTQPAIQGTPTSSNATVGPVRQFYSWSVQPDVQVWVNVPVQNHGWMVKDANETATNDIIAYVSAEEFTNPDLPKRPKLTIDFTAPICSTNADCVEVPDNLCTTNERCQAGHCAVDPVVCNDNNACTDDICDPEQGCLFTVGECNDGFSCTIDTCTPQGGCTHTPVNSECTAEGCKVGTCVADEGNPSVDPATGCVFTATNPDNTPCNPDSDQCTDDKCLAGQCTHPFSTLGKPCAADGNPCTDDVCDGAGTCGVNNTAPCTDGDACTDPDQCSGGTCMPGGPLDCNDNNICTDEICNSGAGCVYTNNSNPCSDGNACTVGDQCGGGACVPGPAPNCNDNNVCTDDSCNASGGCENINNTNPCDDGDQCTIADQCTGGVCAGNPLTCGDGIVQAGCGEECDDAGPGPNCTTQCKSICGPAPQIGCRKPAVAKKAVIVLKDKSPDKKDTLLWKWNKGTATALGDFGDPLTTTGFTLCVYDQSANPQPLIFVKAPPGGMCGTKPCWKATKTGYKYKDKFLDPDGVLGILLKQGVDSVAKIVVKGKGPNVGMPLLPPTPKVTVQLKRDDDLGTCWDAEYTTPIKSLPDQFKAIAD